MIIRAFDHTGSLNVFNKNNSSELTNTSPFIPETIVPSAPFKFYGYCEMFDQEPIDLNAIMQESLHPTNRQNYLDNSIHRKDADDFMSYISKLTNPIEFITKFSSSMHSPIVCHSEYNSNAIKMLKDHGFIPVHYWYHAIISLYWFQSYKLLHPNYNLTPHRFGLYARDASGTRKYRLNILKYLTNIKKNLYFIPQEPIKSQDPMLFNTEYTNYDPHNIINSDSSATIHWPDTHNFDIHLVAETLFDTEKTHLTEKIIKPIVMGQPFITFSGPFSLKYIKHYGFKTFNNIWNEDYDNEVHNDKRFTKIINVINELNNLPKSKYTSLINQAKKIADFNRTHFYSTKFNDILMNELYHSLLDGYNKQQESFFTNPGGTWFSILNTHYMQNIKFPIINYERNRNLVKYTKLHYPTVADQIIKKYNHLL